MVALFTALIIGPAGWWVGYVVGLVVGRERFRASMERHLMFDPASKEKEENPVWVVIREPHE